MKKTNYTWSMVVLATITLVLSSYGLFRLAHDFGDVPAALAVLAISAFDLFAIAAAAHAMRIARDGDSAGPWNLAVIGAAVLSSGLQYAHTQLAGQPVAVGVMMGTFPIATVILFEGTLRRAYRLNGRRTGRVAQPRASFEILQWILYPRATMEAFRYGLLDRTLGSDASFKMAMVKRAELDQVDFVAAPRRELDVEWGRIVPGMAELTSGLKAGSVAGSSGESAEPAPDTRSIRTLVGDSAQVRGPDAEAIIADVRAVRPDAREDTIRREIRKVSGLRSA